MKVRKILFKPLPAVIKSRRGGKAGTGTYDNGIGRLKLISQSFRGP